MNELLARHTPSICLQCRDGVHRCHYGDEYGDCGRKGSPIALDNGGLGFYCREHNAMTERG
jgi:hypothetical protein